MLKFELKVALRHLLTSHGQTELTVGAVAVGVVLVVFLSSLLNGLRIGMVEDVVGTIPHVRVEAASPSAKPLWEIEDSAGGVGRVVTKLEKMSSQKRTVDQWSRLVETIETLPEVQAAAPSVEGTGFASRGSKKIGAMVLGIIPEEQMRVISLRSRVVEGSFAEVDQQNAAIGVRMSEDLNAGIGSRIRVTSGEGETHTFRVACIFDLGVEEANKSTAFVGLSAAQALFRTGKDVTTISVRVADIYDADKVAEEIGNFAPLEVTSWMGSHQSFLDNLRMQNASALIVQAMTLLASAFGVASVMIVFVVQKARDIGILKSMGATSKQIQRVFVLEGLGVGLGGAIVGSAIGTGLCYLVESMIVPGQKFGGEPATVVPMQWDLSYVLVASAVAIAMGLLSSVVPARRAAKLNPVEAIRRGL